MGRAKIVLPLFIVIAVLLALSVPHASAGNGVWTSGGPEGGLVRVIAPSPNFANDGTIFSSGQNHGVLKSTDRGTTWFVSNSGMGNVDVRSIAISPAYASDRTLFAASLDGGVFRSTNGGQSWTAINNGLTTNLVWSLAISPQFPTDRTIFAGTDNQGVFRSTDAGNTWVQVNTGLTLPSILAMAVSPDFANDRTVFAAAQGGLFKSTDGGSTWLSANTGITREDLRAVVFSPAYASDGTAFVGAERGGVFKTTNRGQSWADPSGGRGPVDISGLAISPNYAQDHTIYASNDTYGYSRSTDGGVTWLSHISLERWFPRGTNPDGLCIGISPNYATDGTFWVGTIGSGIFRTQDFGQTFDLARTGYWAARTDAVVTSPDYLNDHYVFALALGGGLYGSSDSGQTWRTINNGLNQRIGFGLVSAIAASPDFTTDRTLFAGRVDPYKVVRSLDGGDTWQPADVGLPSNDIYTILLSPSYPSDGTLFALSASYGVYRSTSFGDSWAAVNTGLTSLRGRHLAMSSGFVSDRTLFVATDGGGVFRSTNAGNTWQAVNSGLGSLSLRRVALSPNFPTDRTLFVVTSVGIYRSVNAGDSWALSYSYYGLKALAVSPRFAQDQTVYAGGPAGVLRSTDGGIRWANISAGMGHSHVSDLAVGLEQVGHTVFASTVGGSVWQLTTGGAAPPATSTPTASPPPGTPTSSPTMTRTATPYVSPTHTRTASATPTSTPTRVLSSGPFRINAGGPAYTDTAGRLWVADQAYTPGGFGYVGGKTYTTTAAIANTDDDVLYQSEHWGMSTYTFDLANGQYRVHLLFDEIYDTKEGNRYFNVKIQGTTVLSNFCPFAAAGGRNIALRYEYPATVNNGQLFIEFVAIKGSAKINAIAVEPITASTTATPTPSPSRTATRPPGTPTNSPTATRVSGSGPFRINAGGPAYTDTAGRLWVADQAYTPGGFGYVGGKTYTTTAAIANTDDDVLYQSEHWGMSAYTFDLANGQYRVHLLFDEIYDTKEGNRYFNVKIQGTTVLSNFCPFAAAGGRNIALRYEYPATVSNGQLLIEFVAIKGSAKINAIAVEPVAASTTATPTPTQPSSPTATPTATRPAGPAAVDIAVNAGGSQYRAQDGSLWLADQEYRSGSWGYQGGQIFTTNQPITGTVDDTLYQSERWGMTGYRFDVPNGTYTVQLKFAEIYYWARNLRVFDVQIEGQTVLSSLDIFAIAGRFTVYDRSFTVSVTDGSLDITFVPRLKTVKINAIRVTSVP